MFSDREANKEPPSSRLWEDPFPPYPGREEASGGRQAWPKKETKRRGSFPAPNLPTRVEEVWSVSCDIARRCVVAKMRDTGLGGGGGQDVSWDLSCQLQGYPHPPLPPCWLLDPCPWSEPRLTTYTLGPWPGTSQRGVPSCPCFS